MQRTAAITKLSVCAEALKARGATSLYLFGSMARDEARSGSNLDVFLDYDPEGKFSLLDLTTRDSLHPLLREKFERSAIRVF
jgi:hypothetical protein